MNAGQEIEAWLARMAGAEEPPADIVAFNIGLFETATGVTAYLIGARWFDPADDDWACVVNFTPAERYLAVFEDPLVDWETALCETVAAIQRFLDQPQGQASFLGRAEAVTAGFDGGDLHRIR